MRKFFRNIRAFLKKFYIAFLAAFMLLFLLFLIRYEYLLVRTNIDAVEKSMDISVKRSLGELSKELQDREIINNIKSQKFIISPDTFAIDDAFDFILKNKYYDSLKNQISTADTTLQRPVESPVLNFNNKNRTIFVLKLLVNLTEKKISISNRINPNYVDSLLKKILAKNGINSPYEFALVKDYRDTIFKTRNFDSQFNKKVSSFFYYFMLGVDRPKVFSRKLFDSDFVDIPNYNIVLYFPLKSYFYTRLYKFITPIVVIILVNVLIFAVSIWFLIRNRKLNIQKERFLHNMIHELKTPIATIKLSSEMLKDPSVNLPKDAYAQLGKTIHLEADRLLNLVEKILQVGMLEKGKTVFQMNFYVGDELVMEAVENFKIHIENVNGDLELHLNGKDAIILVDSMHFQNVITNLLDNAVKYRDKSRKLKIVIETGLDEKKYHYVIRIKDNGLGMPNDVRKNIFQDFYRGTDLDVHNVKGFGLGLSYVKRVIDEFSGRIEVESTLNEGTVFTIKLPLVENKS